MTKPFPELLAELLVAEHNRTPEEAAALVKKHTAIVAQGIRQGMTFQQSLRVTAIAIELAESGFLVGEGSPARKVFCCPHCESDDLVPVTGDPAAPVGPGSPCVEARRCRQCGNEFSMANGKWKEKSGE